MTVKLAIFDVDGTLIDSRASIYRAAVDSALELGISPPSYDDVRAIVGISLRPALAMMRPELDDKTLTAYTAAFQQAFLRFHNEPGFHEPLYDGAKDALLKLKDDGWLLGMATGNSRRGIERFTKSYGWEGLFDASFCADDSPSKPHPQMVLSNLSLLGVDASRAIMIGDTTHDVRMATNAKVKPIGVSWGFHTIEELRREGEFDIAHSFKDLHDYIEQFETALGARS